MLQLNDGDRVRFHCTFEHRGAAYAGARLHAAIGKRGLLWPHIFNEIQDEESPSLSVNSDESWEPYSYDVDITIDASKYPDWQTELYEAYVKLIGLPGGFINDIFWYGPEDDIQIGAVGEAEFANLNVAYSKL